MNWFDNVSSDSDQPVAAARLMEGHWRHRLHPFGDLVLCRLVIDVAEPRVVAAQVIEHGVAEDFGSSELEDLSDLLIQQDIHLQARAWGFTPCTYLPAWAKPSFSDSQIEELERIDGYLVEASDDNIEDVLQLREDFLKAIGVTDQHILRAARSAEPEPVCRKGLKLLN
ncbi:hypothetical protein WNB94_16600 [Aquabacterium sp. A3]|mgnify:FL=1|uniref:hypothetical protein n=1 Tax=Aquabacterium sp. A3 TaxID=3132829 RepID=UPI00311A8DED